MPDDTPKHGTSDPGFGGADEDALTTNSGETVSDDQTLEVTR